MFVLGTLWEAPSSAAVAPAVRSASMSLTKAKRIRPTERLAVCSVQQFECQRDQVAHPFVDPLYLPGCIQIDRPRVPQFSVAIASHP